MFPLLSFHKEKILRFMYNCIFFSVNSVQYIIIITITTIIIIINYKHLQIFPYLFYINILLYWHTTILIVKYFTQSVLPRLIYSGKSFVSRCIIRRGHLNLLEVSRPFQLCRSFSSRLGYLITAWNTTVCPFDDLGVRALRYSGTGRRWSFLSRARTVRRRER